MMEAKQSSVVFVLFLVLAKQKRLDAAAPYDAFSNNINACLFSDWAAAGVLKITIPYVVPVVNCNGQDDVQLCYGDHNNGKALFAVCYNTNTLIPEFTGNKVQHGGTVGAPNMVGPGDDDYNWKSDASLGQMQPPRQVARYEDYAKDQKDMFKRVRYYDFQKHFLARGHLTPIGDFRDTNSEKSFTCITTNIAPQWQPFNEGNWANLEATVKRYAGQKAGRTLYVFTGTGGKAKYLNQDIKLNGKVLTPKYYWKAVCNPDPKVRQSIVFVAENKPGEVCDAKVQGCNGIQQTKFRGIINCYSLQEAAQVHADFKLPPFSDANCNPNNKGTFLDAFLKAGQYKLH